jgi:hypothetical protein
MTSFVAISALFVLTGMMVSGAGTPAIDGKWISDANQLGTLTFEFKLDGDNLTGTATAGSLGPADISNGKVLGDRISFEVTRKLLGSRIVSKYSGTVAGTVMNLHVSNNRGEMELVVRKQ